MGHKSVAVPFCQIDEGLLFLFRDGHDFFLTTVGTEFSESPSGDSFFVLSFHFPNGAGRHTNYQCILRYILRYNGAGTSVRPVSKFQRSNQHRI